MADGELRDGEERTPARVLTVQVVSYAVLFGLAVVLGFAFGMDSVAALGAAILLVAVILVVFHVCWPFRAGLPDRLIGLVAGVLSVTCAVTPLASDSFFPAAGPLALDGKHLMYRLVRWAVCFAVLLIVLTIVAFGRQMAREERSHLIRALSHCVTGGAASVSVAGWCFLPDLVTIGAAAPDEGLLGAFIAVMAVFAVIAVLFAICSVPWWREADPDPALPAPWVGIGLLPVMFSGLMVFAACFVMQLLGA
ncbi:hypothetical protein D2E25_1893 [Bifidobacterium goeldii]|uniref:Uncharacterized protein n=2 Tax=Bifidobacterium goeldii TaxID=2306975 RepID=A0A430FDS5_9BIFI|nr:hypothetical protein D2E25_1893 [Bifidobacterium goeldii]